MLLRLPALHLPTQSQSVMRSLPYQIFQSTMLNLLLEMLSIQHLLLGQANFQEP